MASRRKILKAKCATIDGALKPLGSLPPPKNGRGVAKMDKFMASELSGAIINEGRVRKARKSDLGFLLDVIFATFSEDAYGAIRAQDLLCTPSSLKEHAGLLISTTSTSDDPVHLYDAQKNQWNWRFPSGNSSSKNKLADEAQIALFLNTVMSAVAASVTAQNPTNPPRKQRFWMADWSSECLPGATGYQRKPDLILVSSAIVPRDEITWLSPKVIGEYSREPFQPASRLGKTMDTKAYLVMVEQPWRRFVLGLSLANKELRVHFYDHSGGAISPPFNIHTEPDSFLYILSAVVFGIRSSIGFDMTVTIHLSPSYTRRQATALLALASEELRNAAGVERLASQPVSSSLESSSLATDLAPPASPLETQQLRASEPGSSSVGSNSLCTPLELHSLQHPLTSEPITLASEGSRHAADVERGSPELGSHSLTTDPPPSASLLETQRRRASESGSSPPVRSNTLFADLPPSVSSLDAQSRAPTLPPASGLSFNDPTPLPVPVPSEDSTSQQSRAPTPPPHLSFNDPSRVPVPSEDFAPQQSRAPTVPLRLSPKDPTLLPVPVPSKDSTPQQSHALTLPPHVSFNNPTPSPVPVPSDSEDFTLQQSRAPTVPPRLSFNDPTPSPVPVPSEDFTLQQSHAPTIPPRLSFDDLTPSPVPVPSEDFIPQQSRAPTLPPRLSFDDLTPSPVPVPSEGFIPQQSCAPTLPPRLSFDDLTPAPVPVPSEDSTPQFSLTVTPPVPKSTTSIGTIAVRENVYTIIDILFSSTGFLGRGTICYLVCSEGQYYVIKDHWVQNDRLIVQHQNPLHEVHMMKLVQGIKGVPTLVDFWAVEILPGVTDTTQRYREESWWQCMKSTRTHVRLVMKPCARPLTMFKTKRELVTCIRDILRIQRVAVEERGVLHRDCSINNAMIEDTEDGAHGFFLDWEFAVELNKRNEYEIGGTGTLPFLSTNLLAQLKSYVNDVDPSSIRKSASLTHVNIKTPVTVVHTYADDIESLFYVFIWILVLYDGPLGHEREGVAHENTLLSFWSEEASTNFDTARFAKYTFLVSKRSELESQISSYFSDLLPLAESWRKLLGSYVHEEGLVPFEVVLKLLDDFLAKMPDEKNPDMNFTLHGLAEQHRLLNAVVPPRPNATDLEGEAADTLQMPPNHTLREEVRSMGNPPYPVKRFKAV